VTKFDFAQYLLSYHFNLNTYKLELCLNFINLIPMAFPDRMLFCFLLRFYNHTFKTFGFVTFAHNGSVILHLHHLRNVLRIFSHFQDHYLMNPMKKYLQLVQLGRVLK